MRTVKRILILFFVKLMKSLGLLKVFPLAGLLFIGACSSDIKDDVEIPIEPEEPEENYVNLSEEGLANCYIVQSPGSYMLKADNLFNQGEGLPVPPEIKPDSAALIWQTERSGISKVFLVFENEDPYIKFKVEKAKGNALIAVFNQEGEIEWSWHIWMPTEEPYSVMSASGCEVMSMNLGALDNKPGSASSYGMLYQWGRKDPFPASATLTGDVNTLSAPMYDITNRLVLLSNSSWYDDSDNTLEYSISHPTEVLSNYSHYASTRDWLKSEEGNDALWGNPNGYEKDESNIEFVNKGRKTCYDPSPLGWRVPSPDVFMFFTPTGGYAWDYADFNIHDFNGDGVLDINDYNYGWHFLMDSETPLFFPASSRFDGSYAMLMGSMSGLWGNYWSNSPSQTMIGGGFCALGFQVQDQYGNPMVSVSPSASSSKADAFAVRCIRDN